MSAVHDNRRVCRAPDIAACLVILVVTIFFRLPFFFASVINPDESTFIIMGQDMLDGHLPYVHLFDFKPPLAFAVYAVFLFLGRSIWGFRLAGALYIALASCFLYHAGKKLYDRQTGFLVAFLLVAALSKGLGGNPIMTEQVALLPLCIMIWLACSEEHSGRSVFFMGLALGAAALVRGNIIYLAPGMLAAVLAWKAGVSRRAAAVSACLLAAGLLVLPAAMALVYAAAGQFQLLFKSLVVISRHFVESDYTIRRMLLEFWKMFLNKVILLSWMLYGLLAVGVVLGLRKSAAAGRHGWRSIGVFALLFALMLVSIICTGHYHPHYFIQLLPFAAIIAGYGVYLLPRKTWLRTSAFVAVILLASPILNVSAAYTKLNAQLRERGSLFSDTGYQIVSYLAQKGADGRSVVFFDYHIGYWLLGAEMPTRYVHPSNIGREYMLKALDGPGSTIEGELRKMFDRRPCYVVCPSRMWYFHRKINKYIKSELARNYLPEKKIHNVRIHRRKDLPGPAAGGEGGRQD